MHLPRYLSRKNTPRKGQALVEFVIIFPVMFLLIAILYSLFTHMLLWQSTQANLWFVLRETSTDAYVQQYSAEECGRVIQEAFPKYAWVSVSSDWSQTSDDTLKYFNWLQPLDPCYMESVTLTCTSVDFLSIYWTELSTVSASGTVWTSWTNRHFNDYQTILQILMNGMYPIYMMLDSVMNMLGALPHAIVKILSGH